MTTDHTPPATWIDGHPHLEAIAAAVWERCDTENGLVVDDPRNIALAALAAVLPPPADRAAVLTGREKAMLAFALEMAEEEIHARSLDFTDDDKAALASLRRMADETQPADRGVTVHAIPLPGSNGISACCERPPCKFVGERVTRDPDKVTCTGLTAAAERQDGAQP